MATFKSTQRTAASASPPTKQAPNERGKLMRYYFDYTVGASDTGSTDDIELIDLPKGARLFGGIIHHEAMTSGGSTATLSVGISGDVAIYAAAEDVDAAGNVPFGNTIALLFGQLLTSAITLLATVSVEGLASGQKLSGFVDVLEP